MDVLETVIFSLTSDEVRRFKILSNRFKADEEKKLLVLFDAIRSDKYAGEENQTLEELYKENNAQTRNRYYRLRNKLLDNIEKSLVFYHFKYKDSIHAYYDIQLSIMFRERGNYRLALYFLKKAEKKAKELDQFNILEQIFEEYTQLAMKDIEIDIETILEDRKANLEKIRVHRRNTEALALITQRLKKSNFSRTKSSVLDLLSKTRKRIEKSADIFQSPEGRIQIFRTVSTLLLQKEAYQQLVEYVRQTITEFETENLFNNDNHATRLLMRVWLANGLYKTSRFTDALTELQVLEQEMKMYNKQNYFTYLFNFYNTKINALKCLGKNAEAGGLIEEALSKKEIRSNSLHEAYLMSSLADYYFNAQRFKEALQVLKDLKLKDGFTLFDPEIQMALEIFEQVNLYESRENAEVEKQLKPMRKRFKHLLKADEYERTDRFLDLFARMNTAELEGKRVSLKAAYKGLESYFTGRIEHGNNEIIHYGVYILSKIDKRPYYDVFLEKLKASAQEA